MWHHTMGLRYKGAEKVTVVMAKCGNIEMKGSVS